jgi:2-succinyl-5-enolpyruvyl-6-hydroxy-3-cyclohexene-1-carboxylate synthase
VSVQATFSATLVDEWVRRGVSEAVICPGSRSTPLALALARNPGVRTHVRLDERSAGFFALGLAMAGGRPVVLCVTSGTAAAELLPAVVEASHAGRPLIVCTADRPTELHDSGASQTIEQVGLFASVVRWATAPGVANDGQAATWRPLAARTYAEALDGSGGPGPVHLNLAFREPLGGTPGPLPSGPGPTVVGTRSGHAEPRISPLSGRGLILVGGQAPRPADPRLVGALADRLGWPVLADPLSGGRVPGTIAAADAIVRTGPPLPGTVVLLGAAWLSKAVAGYVREAAGAGARVVVVDPWHRWPDPDRVATEFHRCHPDVWLAAAERDAQRTDDDWLASWRDREERAQRALAGVLGRDLNEPQVARVVHRWAAARGADLFVSASMPLRDLEWFAEPTERPPRVLANRGVNGIDGIVSSALGVAASSGAPRTLALLGDLAFLHDVSGLVDVPSVPCTLVVVDNGGGGIFSFLPQASEVEPPLFEQLFGTPPTTDLGAVARAFGLEVSDVTSLSQLEAALDRQPSGPSVVRARVPSREGNVLLHHALNQAVRLSLQ